VQATVQRRQAVHSVLLSPTGSKSMRNGSRSRTRSRVPLTTAAIQENTLAPPPLSNDNTMDDVCYRLREALLSSSHDKLGKAPIILRLKVPTSRYGHVSLTIRNSPTRNSTTCWSTASTILPSSQHRWSSNSCRTWYPKTPCTHSPIPMNTP